MQPATMQEAWALPRAQCRRIFGGSQYREEYQIQVAECGEYSHSQHTQPTAFAHR